MAVLQEINQSGTLWTDIWQCSTTKMGYFFRNWLVIFQWNSHQMFSFVCLFRGFVPLEIRHHYRWKLGYTRQAFMVIEQWGFFSVLHVLYYDTGHPLIWKSQRTRDTRNCCRAFGSEVDTTYFSDLDGLETHFPHAMRTLYQLIMSHSGGPNHS